jgi:hypothetical protein
MWEDRYLILTFKTTTLIYGSSYGALLKIGTLIVGMLKILIKLDQRVCQALIALITD